MSNERVRVITEEQYKEYMKLKNHFGDTNKKVRRWTPELCKYYYYVSQEQRRVVQDYYGGFDYENNLYTFGNCFKTEEEAQKELDRRLAEQEILDFCDLDVRKPYQISYYVSEMGFKPVSFGGYDSPYRFASEESAQKAIDTLGTEKLKLIFRID